MGVLLTGATYAASGTAVSACLAGAALSPWGHFVYFCTDSYMLSIMRWNVLLCKKPFVMVGAGCVSNLDRLVISSSDQQLAICREVDTPHCARVSLQH